MIKFTDGTGISWEEAAQIIETEGRLITGTVYDENAERCIYGVLCGYGATENIRQIDGEGMFQAGISGMISVNNTFDGTPEERCAYMAAWLRARDGA